MCGLGWRKIYKNCQKRSTKIIKLYRWIIHFFIKSACAFIQNLAPCKILNKMLHRLRWNCLTNKQTHAGVIKGPFGFYPGPITNITSITKLVPGCAKSSLFLARFQSSFSSNMVKNAKRNQLIEHVKSKLK